MTEPLLDRRQVLKLLNVSYDWFSRHRKDLEAAGFPPPLPAFGTHQGARWDPQAINAWLARQRGEDPPAAPEDPPAGGLSDEELDALLDARSRHLAETSLPAAE